MDRYNLGEERLIAPDKYTSAGTTRKFWFGRLMFIPSLRSV